MREVGDYIWEVRPRFDGFRKKTKEEKEWMLVKYVYRPDYNSSTKELLLLHSGMISDSWQPDGTSRGVTTRPALNRRIETSSRIS